MAGKPSAWNQLDLCSFNKVFILAQFHYKMHICITLIWPLFSCHRMPSQTMKVPLMLSCRNPFLRRMVWESRVWDSWINSEVLWEHPLWLCPQTTGADRQPLTVFSSLYLFYVSLASCVMIPFISPCCFLNACSSVLLQVYLEYLSHCLVDSLTNLYLGSLRCRWLIPREPPLASDHTRNLINVNEPTPWPPSDLLV